MTRPGRQIRSGARCILLGLTAVLTARGGGCQGPGIVPIGGDGARWNVGDPLLRAARTLAATGLLALLACGGGHRELARPPIVLVVVDTLRADRLGVYGHERPTSPAIDALAARGVVFEHAHATSSWTIPSMGSLFTGRLPSRHGADIARDDDGEVLWRDGRRVFLSLDESVPTLAERLRDAGYATGAVVTNNFMAPRMGFDRGFDHYEWLGSLPPAPVVVSQGLAWLDASGDRPPFLLLHLFDPHLPYAAGRSVAGRFTGEVEGAGRLPVAGLRKLRRRAPRLSPEERAFIAAAYDEEVAFVDAAVGRLVAGLQQRGLLEDALLVLTSDHGEELFDHGSFEHGHSMYQELLRVPLVFFGPEIAPRRIETPVSLLDVAPTLLEAAGVEAPAGPSAVSLWPTLRAGVRPPERPLPAESSFYGEARSALVRWPHKLVAGPELRLFDLERDAEERENLAEAQPERTRRLAEELDALLEEAARDRRPATEVQFDPLVRDRLRALGYLEPE